MIDHEKKIIQNIKNGNQQAFKKLYDAYANYALRTTFAITRNNNYVTDIVQETFIRVYRSIDKFNLKQPFKPWFYRILLNESIRYMKKQKKEPTCIEPGQLNNYMINKQTENESHDHLAQALDHLSETHRTVLVLKYMNEFTEKEIANLLNLNINTVKSRLYKARQKLKKALGEINNE